MRRPGPASRGRPQGCDRQAGLEPAASRMEAWRSSQGELLPDKWSWRDSNPRPQKRSRGCYDHSRVCGLRLPPRRVEEPRGSGRRVFLRCQRSLPAVSGSLPAVHRCFWCRAAAVWPRVPLLVAVPLCQPDQLRRRGRERRCRRLLGCPVSRVWATLVATGGSSGSVSKPVSPELGGGGSGTRTHARPRRFSRL